jgi:hypothetical protein
MPRNTLFSIYNALRVEYDLNHEVHACAFIPTLSPRHQLSNQLKN